LRSKAAAYQDRSGCTGGGAAHLLGARSSTGLGALYDHVIRAARESDFRRFAERPRFEHARVLHLEIGEHEDVFGREPASISNQTGSVYCHLAVLRARPCVSEISR